MIDFARLFSEFTPGAYGIFAVLAAVLVALVKAWPILSAQAQAAKDRLRGERRDDLNDCKSRLDAMSTRLDEMVSMVNNLKIEINGVLAAYRILEIDVETRDPNSVALRQARAILSTAFTVAPSTPPPFERPPVQPEND